MRSLTKIYKKAVNVVSKAINNPIINPVGVVGAAPVTAATGMTYEDQLKTGAVVGSAAYIYKALAAPVAPPSSPGVETMPIETITTPAPAPTIYDQLKGIVTDGVTKAASNAVNKATTPSSPAPVYGGNAAAPVIPVWGWALGGVAVTGLILFLALRK